ncbi:ubiquitin-like-specific protease ESD4 [Apium graveolens]|uniref:ubiquitin-like-specific protease ESD4 n=1 Tax=Apium graveolens TaxID=4045 RepID=UPI003D78ED3B
MKEEKWSITKSLSMTKKNAIYSDWGWCFGMEPRIPGGLTVQDYHVHASAMQSLAPGTWVDDRIIYTYMGLLRSREEEIHTGGIWERKLVYYFMDPYFMRAWNKALRSFTSFATATVGPSVLEVDYIFILCYVRDVHWVLFMFGTRRFEGLIIDSMNDEPDYHEDIRVMPVEGRDPTSAEVLALPSRPKQRNSNDCGVYVMKYMDYFTQGYDLAEVPNWSQEEVDTFRYWIARELHQGKARGIPGIRMRRRHEAS